MSLKWVSCSWSKNYFLFFYFLSLNIKYQFSYLIYNLIFFFLGGMKGAPIGVQSEESLVGRVIRHKRFLFYFIFIRVVLKSNNWTHFRRVMCWCRTLVQSSCLADVVHKLTSIVFDCTLCVCVCAVESSPRGTFEEVVKVFFF